MSDIIKFEKDENFLPSTPADIVKTANVFYTNQEIAQYLEKVPDEMKNDFKAHLYEASFWKHIEDKQVPFEFLKKRKGSKDKETGEYKMLEYFPADYTLIELNRLFPGWWQEDMHVEPDYKLRTMRVWGYLCVEYPTIAGKKITKRWATASSAIKITTEIDIKTNMYEASQPDDLEKSAMTEWFKIVGKYFGIGLEIYHQRITPELRSLFEDTVRDWGVYKDEACKIVATLVTGQAMRDYIMELPTKEQTNRLLNALHSIPADLKNNEGQSFHDLTWKNFIRLKNNSYENKLKTETFLRQLESASEKLRSQKQN